MMYKNYRQDPSMYERYKKRPDTFKEEENLLITSENILCLHGILEVEAAAKHLGIPEDLVRQIWESGDNTLLHKYVEQNRKFIPPDEREKNSLEK